MSAPITMDRLLVLRRLSRALEQSVHAYGRGHVTTLAPLCRPRPIGDLPVTVLASAIHAVRSPDDVLVQSTETTGTSTFQKVVDVDRLHAMPDPFRGLVTEVLAAHGERLPPA